MKNLVTIYITNHNYGRFLNESINSVLNQSYKNIFLVIVDDFSKDNSKKILKSFEKKKNIKIIYNKKKRGLIKSANIAIKNSKGDFILRLDADDFLHKDAINHMVSKIISKHKNYKMVFPDFYRVNQFSQVISKYKYKHKLEYNLRDRPSHGACCLINLKFLKKIKLYNESFDRQDGHYLWYYLLIKKNKICHIKKPLFFYRKHSSNLSDNKKKILMTRLNILIFFQKKKIFSKEFSFLINKTSNKLKRISKEK